MNTDRFRVLKAVIERGSFSAAARELGVTQPAVSMSVRALEEALGETLIDRDGERLYPTPAGRLVYERGGAILDQLDELLHALQALRGKVAGRLHIGASTIPAEYILPPVLREFRQGFPDVELALTVAGTGEVLDRLLDRTVDVAIVGRAPADGRVMSFEIGSDEIWLIDSPISSAPDPVDAGWLRRANFVWREPGSGTRAAMEHALAACGLDPAALPAAATLGSTESVIAAVEAGLGVSFVSSFAAERAVRLGRVRVLRSPCRVEPRAFHFAALRSRADHPAVRECQRLFRQRAANR